MTSLSLPYAYGCTARYAYGCTVRYVYAYDAPRAAAAQAIDTDAPWPLDRGHAMAIEMVMVHVTLWHGCTLRLCAVYGCGIPYVFMVHGFAAYTLPTLRMICAFVLWLRAMAPALLCCSMVGVSMEPSAGWHSEAVQSPYASPLPYV